ncbi:hypothetical protein ACL02S_09905 [Nocardia sp. 004]|uniref:hypothetical protein n=1 Tax=Nocardia sp. 004 TaxID=3385978 RepID=UPI0039A271FD
MTARLGSAVIIVGSARLGDLSGAGTGVPWHAAAGTGFRAAPTTSLGFGRADIRSMVEVSDVAAGSAATGWSRA